MGVAEARLIPSLPRLACAALSHDSLLVQGSWPCLGPPGLGFTYLSPPVLPPRLLLVVSGSVSHAHAAWESSSTLYLQERAAERVSQGKCLASVGGSWGHLFPGAEKTP